MAVSEGSFDSWQRKAFISVESSSTVKMQYESLTSSISIEVGEREYDKIDLLNLGQIAKHGPMGIVTLTLEGYPMYAGTPDTSDATRGTPKSGIAKSYWEVFAQVGHMDTADPVTNTITNDVTRYRVAILWTDQSTLSDTASASSNGAPPTITVDGTPFTADDYNGAMLKMTSGTASGGVYMITDTSTSAFTLTTGDTPLTDGVADNDSLEVYPTGSSAVVTSGTKGRRFVLADCTCVSCTTDFTDGILKQTLVFKGKPFSNTGSGLVKCESTAGDVQLVALGDYTPSTTYWA